MNRIIKVTIDILEGDTQLTFVRQDGKTNEYVVSEDNANRFDRANQYGEHPRRCGLTVYTYEHYIHVAFHYEPEAVEGKNDNETI